MIIRLLTSLDSGLLLEFLEQTGNYVDHSIDPHWLVDSLSHTQNFAMFAAINENNQITAIIAGCTFNHILKNETRYNGWYIIWNAVREHTILRKIHRNLMIDKLAYYFEQLGYTSIFFSAAPPKNIESSKWNLLLKRQYNIQNYDIEILDVCYDRVTSSPIKSFLTYYVKNFPVVLIRLNKKQ